MASKKERAVSMVMFELYQDEVIEAQKIANARGDSLHDLVRGAVRDHIARTKQTR